MPEYWTSLSKSLAYLVGYIGKLWLGPLSPDLLFHPCYFRILHFNPNFFYMF